jgi:hypothetical protein
MIRAFSSAFLCNLERRRLRLLSTHLLRQLMVAHFRERSGAGNLPLL